MKWIFSCYRNAVQWTQTRITIAACWVTLVCSQMLVSSQLPIPFILRNTCSVSPLCGLSRSSFEHSDISFLRWNFVGNQALQITTPFPLKRHSTPLAIIILKLPFSNQKELNRFYVQEASLMEKKNPDTNNKRFPSRTGPDCPLIVLICLMWLHIKSVLKSLQGNWG